MTGQELRQKFLKFFEKNDHAIIPSASLVPLDEEQLEGKEKVLFTSAGMQPLIPYLMGKSHPKGKKLADVQKCIRTDDIEEVGDEVHHTFFEMLGNWSLGGYWKDDAIELSFKFLTEELQIPIEKLAISVFSGDGDSPRDEESANKWKKLGIPDKRIAYLGKEANWWPTSRKDLVTGELKNAFGPCGPDTEMFVWIGEGLVPQIFNPDDKKWVEIWNDVFMEFNRKVDGTLEELPQKNVDTGMGLERMLAVLNEKDNDYETDLFEPIITEIKKSKKKYSEISKRIIADHLRAAVFLLADGVNPDSKDPRGSVVHRLIRDAMTQEGKHLEVEVMINLSEVIISHYRYQYSELSNEEIIKKGIKEVHEAIITGGESEKQIYRLDEAIRQKKEEIYNHPQSNIGVAPISLASTYAGQIAFDYHQTLGTSLPTALNIVKKEGLDPLLAEKAFQDAFRRHQEISRPTPKGMFKGGLIDHSEIVTKYHTATHLLHQALRDVLGPQVFQKGSNITADRLRFDFSFDRKMTDEEIKKTEEIVNNRIEQNLKVDQLIVNLAEAKSMNAIGLFDEKYADQVSIYGIGPNFKIDPQAKDQRARGGYYSLEFCGGPHVKHTLTIGKIQIIKEEAISSGIRRIRAEIVLR